MTFGNWMTFSSKKIKNVKFEKTWKKGKKLFENHLPALSNRRGKNLPSH